MTIKSYEIETESFMAKLDADKIAEGLVKRARNNDYDPRGFIESEVEFIVIEEVRSYQPEATNDDGELLADVTAAVERLLNAAGFKENP